jgi:TolB-like protein
LHLTLLQFASKKRIFLFGDTMLRKYIPTLLLTLSIIASARAQAIDTVMVLPFENASRMNEFNWVGESFADSLTDLLRIPNLNVVSNDERKVIQQRLRIPLNNLPSLATSLKLAREANATLLIAGKYNIVPAQGDMAATVNVTAKIIRVNEGRRRLRTKLRGAATGRLPKLLFI